MCSSQGAPACLKPGMNLYMGRDTGRILHDFVFMYESPQYGLLESLFKEMHKCNCMLCSLSPIDVPLTAWMTVLGQVCTRFSMSHKIKFTRDQSVHMARLSGSCKE